MRGGTPGSTDSSLLERLRAKPADETAWDEFVCRDGPMVHTWCLRWKLSPGDADDVSQDVLVKLVRRMRQFRYDPGRSLRAYLRTVARYTLAEFLDGQSALRRHLAAEGAEMDLDDLPAREDLEKALEAAFDLELLGKASALVAQRVKPHTWEAFRLQAFEGVSAREVARRLGLKLGLVYQAKLNVLRMIRETLSELDAPHGVRAVTHALGV
jgi:RNA polymerase sigma factor (sigma-70 family)